MKCWTLDKEGQNKQRRGSVWETETTYWSGATMDSTPNLGEVTLQSLGETKDKSSVFPPYLDYGA